MLSKQRSIFGKHSFDTANLASVSSDSGIQFGKTSEMSGSTEEVSKVSSSESEDSTKSENDIVEKPPKSSNTEKDSVKSNLKRSNSVKDKVSDFQNKIKEKAVETKSNIGKNF